MLPERLFLPLGTEALMGDKSPKNKQREKNQKTAAKTQSKATQAARQTPSSPAAKDKKK